MRRPRACSSRLLGNGLIRVCLAVPLAAAGILHAQETKPPAPPLQAVLWSANQVTPERLDQARGRKFNAVALLLEESRSNEVRAAAQKVLDAGFELDYWIEISRNPALATSHPEWMASIQTHPEWRRQFPNFPATKTGEVVKVFPWVPVGYAETYPVHLERVQTLLRGQHAPKAIFLNGLQGAPSACGCGHPLCRWTTDYGPLRTASVLPPETAGRFVADVKRVASGARVIPVWATECEEGDAETLCNGVGCYGGACWREFTRQLTPLANEAEQVGALTLVGTFGRDLPRYGARGEWVKEAVNYFTAMPARYKTNGVAPRRIITVLEGWDAQWEDVATQIGRSREAGAGGCVVAETRIEQEWEPRLFRLP